MPVSITSQEEMGLCVRTETKRRKNQSDSTCEKTLNEV